MTVRVWPSTCARCGCSIIPKTMTKYCRPCSALRDTERKATWARANPASADALKRGKSLYKQKIRERAALVASAVPRSLLWQFDMPMPDMVRSQSIRIPFDRDLSKNAIYSVGRGGHVFLRQRQRALREAIAWSLKETPNREPWPQRKTYLDILVQKPHHKFDAINVIDGICDALKAGIGVDDKWFAIRRLDWLIVKGKPEILIAISQDGTEPQTACSSCGRVLDDKYFTGHKRICVGCTRGEEIP